jgi:hypothetical protein
MSWIDFAVIALVCGLIAWIEWLDHRGDKG